MDNTDFSVKSMKAKSQVGTVFDFNSMSDGERVAFFYIATVIAAPAKSFIIVDEPENRLNPAIYNKIWAKLIEKRKDCQFIFISHTMEFVGARTNFELMKIKNFIYPDKFDFVFLGDSLKNIQSELIVEIVGSRKPILFCEGSKADYDYQVYESLFGEKYTIVPAGNCLSVERSVEALKICCLEHGEIISGLGNRIIPNYVSIALGVLRSDRQLAKVIRDKYFPNISI